MSSEAQQKRVGFIGAGRMATALARGLASAGFTSPECILASDVSQAARERFSTESGAPAVETNHEVLARSEIVVLAVKPDNMSSVLAELREDVKPEHLIVSIAAGIPLRVLTDAFGESSRVVRVMPNTPCLIAAGASAFAIGGAATEADGQLVEQMLSTVGIALAVPDDLMDAVTGLSGSGPAYVYQIIEALSDGGVNAGLPRDVATRLAAQTVMGAARMVLETGEHPSVLKDAVTSPGGTTIAGLHKLEQGGLRATIMNAVKAASLRSAHLGRKV